MTSAICPPFVVSSLRHARPLRLRCKAPCRPRWRAKRRRWTCSTRITRWRHVLPKCIRRPQGTQRRLSRAPLVEGITRRVGRRIATVASRVLGHFRLPRHLVRRLFSQTDGRALVLPSQRSRRRRRVARSHHHLARSRLIAIRYNGRDRSHPCSAPSRPRVPHTARQVHRDHAT